MLLGLFGSYTTPGGPLAPQSANAGADDSEPAPAPRSVAPLVDPHLPSLAIKVDVVPKLASVGDTLTATIHVFNQAADPASNVVITLPRPAGVSRITGLSQSLQTGITSSSIRSGGSSSSSISGASSGSWLPVGYDPPSSASPTSSPASTASAVPSAQSSATAGTATVTSPINSTVSSTPSATPESEPWTWHIPQLNGGGAVTQTVLMQVTANPQGEAVVARVEAMADGLDGPAVGEGGAVLVLPGRGPRSVGFVPGQEANLASYDNHARVRIPGDAANRALTITHGFHAAPEESTPPEAAGFRQGFGTFYLSAVDDVGQRVRQFSRPITITLDYTLEQLQGLGIAEGDLTLLYYDEAPSVRQWVPIDTRVDPATQTVTVAVDHFTAFQLSDGSSPSSAYIPSLQGWQVDLYTGSVSYQYPIDVPAGPAGIKPNVALSYNSASTDGKPGMRGPARSSWVGKGWSLDTGSIALQKVGDNHGNSARYYSMSFNGMSFDVARVGPRPGISNPDPLNPTHWEWRATDENFVRVRVESNGYSYGSAQSPGRGGYNDGSPLPRYKWQVWTKDGTRYDFEEDAWQGWDTQAGGDCLDEDTYFETYKWYLTRIQDPHGNRINYNYSRQDGPTLYYGWDEADGPCTVFGVYGTVDWGVYPTTITWGSNISTGAPDRYMVEFQSTARDRDNGLDVPSNQLFFSPMEMRKLIAVKVYSKPITNWELVRQYNLGYASGNEPKGQQTIYLLSDKTLRNGNTYTPDYSTQKLTLTSIQRVANNGTSGLPATTFTYGLNRGTAQYANGTWNRLTSVNNGQGGVITFSYENIGTVLLGQGNPDHDMFENNRRVTQKVVHDGYGQSWDHANTWWYSYQNPAYNTLGTLLADKGPNAYPNSATVYFNKYWDPNISFHYLLMVHQGRSEFRGHKYVVETDPYLRKTEHWFYQGDARPEEGDWACVPNVQGQDILGPGEAYPDECVAQVRDREALKGKEYKTTIHQSDVNSAKMSETRRTYSVEFLISGTNQGYGYTLTDRLTGLWRSFTYEAVAQERAYEGNGDPNYLVKTTSYQYELQYGNLTQVSEADGAGVQRKTLYQYVSLDDSANYVVDRRWSENIKNNQNEWLARTVYGYDGFNPRGSPVDGDLTLVKKFYDIPISDGQRSTTFPHEAHTSDTRYVYDSYGNQIEVRTYAGNGTVTGLDNEGGTIDWGWVGGNTTPRTTTTIYEPNLTTPPRTSEPAFHSLPLEVNQPNVNGVVLRESAYHDYRMGTTTSVKDPNNQTTYAEYDLWGRMVKLIKPGDSSTIPTLEAIYQDFEIPFKYTIKQLEVSGDSSQVRYIRKFYDGLGREIQVKSESKTNPSFENIVVDKQYDALGQVIQQSQPRYVVQTDPAYKAYLPPSSAFCNDATMRWTCTEYDALGRPVLVLAPDGTQTSMTYAISTADSLQSVTTVDAKSHKTEHRSDMFGRLSKVIEYSGNGVPLPNGEGDYAVYATTSYTYNPLDLLIAVQDGLNKQITMQYDSLGRKTSMTDLIMGTWTYTYNVDGTLATQIDGQAPQRQTITFGYDELGRLRSKTYPDGAHSDYAYDEATATNGKGQRTTMARYSSSGTTGNLVAKTQWNYTARGQQSNATYTVAETTGTRTFSWEYDSGGRMTSIIYPGGEKVTYGYDEAWRQTSACSNPAPNGYNICYAQNATYTALDQPTQFSLGSGALQAYQYNGVMARLSNIQVQAGGTALLSKSYTYDNVGNVDTILNSVLSPTQTGTYTYDHRDRLVRWQVNTTPMAIDENYYYDVMGNFTNKAGVGYGYDYNHAPGGGGPYALRNTGYSYDGNGNMLTGANRAYTWTVENLPDTITSDNWVIEGFLYDAEGERVRKSLTMGDTETYTYYFGGLYEEDQPSGTQRYYYTFAGQTIAQRENIGGEDGGYTSLKYVHADHLGSVSLLTNATGPVQPLGSQEFDPWGKVRTDVPATVGTQTRINYTGQKRDDTGLLYYHARMYDPALGRFVSPDSIVPGASSGVGGAGGTVGQEENSKLTVDFHESGFLTSAAGENATTLQKGFWFQLSEEDREDAREPWGPSNPQALDRYAYVLNNPLRYVDPAGHYLLTGLYESKNAKVPSGFTLTLSRNELKTVLDTIEKYWDLILYAVSGGAGIIMEGLLLAAGVAAFPATVIAALVTGGTMYELIELYDWMKRVYAAGGTLEITVSIGASLETAILTGKLSVTSVREVSPKEDNKIQDGEHVARRCRVGSPSNPRGWISC